MAIPSGSTDAGGSPGADAGGSPGADASGSPGADAGGSPGADAGSGPPADAGPPKPTRLEDWSLAPEGSPPLSMGTWKWDTVEKVHCHFVTAEDDKLRCLPDAPAHLVQYGSLATDATCTQTVWGVQQDGNRPIRRPWATSISTVAPCGPTHHQVLRPLPEGTPLFFSADGKICKPYKPADGDIPMVAMVPDAPERWEEGTATDGQRVSDRLHVADIATADGAHFADHLADDHWNMSCALSPPKSGAGLECLPPSGALPLQPVFSDAMCTTQVEVATSETCQPVPAYVADWDDHRFTVGAPFMGSLYRPVKLPCELVGGSAQQRMFLKGTPLPPDAIATTSLVSAGTGRLRLRGLAGPGNSIVPLRADLYSYRDRPFFDSVTNEDCQPAWTPDGKVRCLPASIPIISERYFSDPMCKRLIFYCGANIDCTTRTFTFGRTQTYGRMTVTEGFAGGTPLTKPDAYAFDGGICRLIGLHADDYYEATGALDWDAFPTLPERNPLPTAP